MPGHTSRPPGHPSILEAVINYRGARRSKELFLVLASGQRRGFIEDGLSNPSIPYGGIDLSSRNAGYILWDAHLLGENVKLKGGSRSKGNRERSKRITPSFFPRIRPVTIDGHNRERS